MREEVDKVNTFASYFSYKSLLNYKLLFSFNPLY